MFIKESEKRNRLFDEYMSNWWLWQDCRTYLKMVQAAVDSSEDELEKTHFIKVRTSFEEELKHIEEVLINLSNELGCEPPWEYKFDMSLKAKWTSETNDENISS